MAFPTFFDALPAIRLHDGLAQLLGACDDGIVDYHYADAVRLAGHSCPTVASAWLMARAAINALYPDTIAERGGMRVRMAAPENVGVTGVIAQIFTLITGAAAANGFHGIGGRFERAGLLEYGHDSEATEVIVTRLDKATSVRVVADLSSIAPHPAMRELAGAVLQNAATAEQQRAFGVAWQDRVKRLLLEHADDAAVIKLVKLG